MKKGNRAPPLEKALRREFAFTEDTVITIASENGIDVLDRIYGAVITNNLMYNVSVHRNTSPPPNGYRYRGTVSLIDPISGNVLRSVDRQKKRDNKNLSCERQKDTYATTQIIQREDDIGMLIIAIRRSIEGLYRRNSFQCHAAIQKTLVNDDITPMVAFTLFGREFIDTEYPHLSNEKREKRLKDLERVLKALPPTPILTVRKNAVENALKEKRSLYPALTMCDSFFCYIIRSWRFSPQQAMPPSPFNGLYERLAPSASSRRVDPIAHTIEDSVYAKFLKILIRGEDSVFYIIALMFSGFSYSDLGRLRWNNIEFVSNYEDFAVVHLFKEELKTAKHDYTRPVIPDIARYLKNAFDRAGAGDSGKIFLERHILEKEDGSLLTYQEISQSVRNILALSGYLPPLGVTDVSSVSLELLKNNYRNRLINQAGLRDDSDTYHFLAGLQLKSTTFINYESHTSADAQYRLYTILKSLCVPRTITKRNALNGPVLRSVPASTAEAATIIVRLKLQPGESFSNRCEHGVYGSVKVITPQTENEDSQE